MLEFRTTADNGVLLWLWAGRRLVRWEPPTTAERHRGPGVVCTRWPHGRVKGLPVIGFTEIICFLTIDRRKLHVL